MTEAATTAGRAVGTAGDGQTIVGISTAAGGGSQIPYESASPIPVASSW